MEKIVKQSPKTEWQEKVWGRTRKIAEGPHFEVHELEILKGGFSSRHWHEKQNLFHIQEGDLLIELFAEDESKEKTESDQVWLYDDPYWKGGHVAGDQCRVAARTWHRFKALTPCRVIEVYAIGHIDSEDIKRFDEGGLDPIQHAITG